jgi:hypothetical protein
MIQKFYRLRPSAKDSEGVVYTVSTKTGTYESEQIKKSINTKTA